MQNDATLSALAEELAQAIELIMNPFTHQKARMEAYEACERFKETSPISARIGFFIACGNFNNSVKHFGLHLVEHTVKFKWNNISSEEKIHIKENAMSLLLGGVGPADEKSFLHLKDALSRIIVEMIKREWPQQWTSLLSELSCACSRGEAQTEIVLLVFLRLVEDVALLQTIESNNRRKDIYQALTMKMTEVFDFFLKITEYHVTSFRNAHTRGESQKARAHCRVVEVVLLTLAGFVEWVSINHIMCENGKLLHILCFLLNDLPFQINASDCLALIVNRKGPLKERKYLCKLFSEETINLIFQASQIVPSEDTMEQNHTFLKKLAQVVNGLSQLLTALLEKDDGIFQCPQSFPCFLECLFSFVQHPSLVISHNGVVIWNQFLKHEYISKQSCLLEYIPKLLKTLGPKIIKVPYPNPENESIRLFSVQSYIRLDYDCETEYNNFFHRCRLSYLEFFRQTTILTPLLTFGYCEDWLNAKLSKLLTDSTLINCNVNDPEHLEWEALATILDNVLNRILFTTDRPSLQSGLFLLEKCLKVETGNPLVFSELLSCVSALFVFLSMASITDASRCNSLLLQVLDKVFKGLTFDGNVFSCAIPFYNATKKLRRHASSLMVKLGNKYPLLLLPIFDDLNVQLKIMSEKISQSDEITLQEAFLLISNHFCDYERQTRYIEEILKKAKENWISLDQTIKSSMSFICFVGLNQEAYQCIQMELYRLNRNQMIYALYMVLGVIKRCSYPHDPEKALRGGFIVGYTDSGNPISRNPATCHILPILPNILSLIKSLNELYTTEAIKILSSDFTFIHAMSESEKKNLLCNISNAADFKKTTFLEKMQRFLTLVYEGCFHAIGSMGPSLGIDLYQLPGISHALLNSIFTNLENVPDHRLRPIIRVFLKPFIHCCPPGMYNEIIIPIFSYFTPFMLFRLKSRWSNESVVSVGDHVSEEMNDSEEVLEDILNRILTREYLDVLKVALLEGQTPQDLNDVVMEQDDYFDDETNSLKRISFSSFSTENLSDLGMKLIQHPIISAQIFSTILSSLLWNDATCNLKATKLFLPVIRYMIAENLIDENLAKDAFVAVLKSLQIHGKNEINQATLITAGVQICEILRPKFPSVLEVMKQIPCVNIVDLQKFDEKILNSSTKGNKVDRAKRDLFRKITSQLSNYDSNELFKNKVHLLDLPPIRPSTSKKFPDVLDDSENEHADIAKLFQ